MEGCVTVSVPRLGITVEASLMEQVLCNSIQELGYVWSVMTSKTIRLIVNNSLILKTVKDVQSLGITSPEYATTVFKIISELYYTQWKYICMKSIL